MSELNQPIKGQYFSLSAYGIPKRCRKEQHYFLKGPFIRDEKITEEVKKEVIAALKSKMISSMKTVKKANVTMNPATLDNGIMSHLISFNSKNTIWSSEVPSV